MEHKIRAWEQKNRAQLDELDDLTPPSDLWNRIESNLPNKPQIKRFGWKKPVQWAAAVVFLITAGLWVFQMGRQQGLLDYSKINPEMALVQEAYWKIIDSKKDSLSHLATFNPELSKQFSQSLQEMEQNYAKLKAELSKSPNPEKTLKAMIVNLEAQANTLNQQLNVFENVYKPQTKAPTHTL